MEENSSKATRFCKFANIDKAGQYRRTSLQGPPSQIHWYDLLSTRTTTRVWSVSVAHARRRSRVATHKNIVTV